MASPVVMIHGAFCGGWVFDQFRRPFEAAGFGVHTPDLPGHSGAGGSTLGLSMTDYARFVRNFCRALPEPPILIGHSMGGLVCQIAAQELDLKGLILLAPSPPWGVTGSSMEEAASAMSLYALGPYWMQSIPPDYNLARLYSLDQMERDERHATFARMVPESGRALWETLSWWLDPMMSTVVNPARITMPVLAISGGRDTIHPTATVKSTATRLSAVTREFSGMSHWLPGEPGHEDVALACMDWLGCTQAAAAGSV